MSTGVKYLHENVHLVCSNGLKTSQLKVADRGVRIADGKLIATKDDKPSNFMCKWAGIAMAIIAAGAIALGFMGLVLGPIAGLLIAFLVGVASAIILGSGLCYLATRFSHWENTHPRVKARGINALTQGSQLKCYLGGQIYAFFSPVIAEKQAWAFAANNMGQILTAASIGSVGGTIFKIGKSSGFLSATMAKTLGLTAAGMAVVNPALTVASGFLSNHASDGILSAGGDPYDGGSSPMQATTENEFWGQTSALYTVGETVKTYNNMVLSVRSAGEYANAAHPEMNTSQWRPYFDKQGYLAETKGMSYAERMRIGQEKYIPAARQQAANQHGQQTRSANLRSGAIKSLKSAAAPFVGGFIFDTISQAFQKNVNDHYVTEEARASADVHVFSTNP